MPSFPIFASGWALRSLHNSINFLSPSKFLRNFVNLVQEEFQPEFSLITIRSLVALFCPRASEPPLSDILKRVLIRVNSISEKPSFIQINTVRNDQCSLLQTPFLKLNWRKTGGFGMHLFLNIRGAKYGKFRNRMSKWNFNIYRIVYTFLINFFYSRSQDSSVW